MKDDEINEAKEFADKYVRVYHKGNTYKIPEKSWELFRELFGPDDVIKKESHDFMILDLSDKHGREDDNKKE